MATQKEIDTKKLEIMNRQFEIQRIEKDISNARNIIVQDESRSELVAEITRKKELVDVARRDLRDTKKILDDSIFDELTNSKGSEILMLATKRSEILVLRQEFRTLKLEE